MTFGATPNSSPPYNPKIVTSYSYLGDPAWHFDEEDDLVPVSRKTWSQWRGYSKVGVTLGEGTDQRTYTESLYFRGMHGDRQSSGTPRDVKVVASAASGAPPVDDDEHFAGMVREQITVLGPNGVEVAGSVSDPWMSEATATRTIGSSTVTARYTGVQATHNRVVLDGNRGYRRTDVHPHSTRSVGSWPPRTSAPRGRGMSSAPGRPTARRRRASG
jgi:hypothetical protein